MLLSDQPLHHTLARLQCCREPVLCWASNNVMGLFLSAVRVAGIARYSQHNIYFNVAWAKQTTSSKQRTISISERISITVCSAWIFLNQETNPLQPGDERLTVGQGLLLTRTGRLAYRGILPLSASILGAGPPPLPLSPLHWASRSCRHSGKQ
jgi:hypothetical protein